MREAFLLLPQEKSLKLKGLLGIRLYGLSGPPTFAFRVGALFQMLCGLYFVVVAIRNMIGNQMEATPVQEPSGRWAKVY